MAADRSGRLQKVVLGKLPGLLEELRKRGLELKARSGVPFRTIAGGRKECQCFMQSNSHPLTTACFASAAIFAMLFDCVMLEARLGGSLPLHIIAFVKVGLIMLALAIVIQFCFGAIVYAVLKGLGLFRWWTVVAVYLLPVIALAPFAETTADMWGLVRWALLASVTGWIFWRAAA